MTWLLFGIAVLGAILNIRRIRWGFGLWCISNFVWAWYNWKIAEYAQACQYIAFFVLSAWGFWQWGRKPKSR